MPTRGRFQKKNSPLPSESLSYPSPNQDPVAPPKQVVFVGRTAALRLHLRPYLKPASKIRLKPARGADKRGDFTSNLATALCNSLLPATHPRPRCSTKTGRRRPHGSATAPSSPVPNKSSQVSTLPKAKSQTRSKQNKDMHNCSSVYSERGASWIVIWIAGEILEILAP